MATKYNRFAKELNDKAHDFFRTYREAQSAAQAAAGRHQAAEQAYNDAQTRGRFRDVSGAALRARLEARTAAARADAAETKAAFQAVRRDRFQILDEAAKIRARLAEQIAADNALDPSMIDSATVALLNSGIIRPVEFLNLYERFTGNSTMQKVISRYASNVPQEGLNDDDRRALNLVIHTANNGGLEILDAFDELVSALRYAVGSPEAVASDSYNENPVIMREWDELTGGAIEDF